MRAILFLLLLSGCAATPYYHWYKPGLSEHAQKLNSDWRECGGGQIGKDDSAVACMKSKGYLLVWSDHSPSNVVPPSLLSGLQFVQAH